jgi:hypothetical protein
VDAEQLYLLAPAEFTAARDAAVKQARADGDRERATALKALRRPTVAAWLLNTLVHEQPGLVEQLLDLGPGLAQAQAGGDAAALRALGEQRRQLVGAVVDRAVADAGRGVTAAVRDELASTMEAALADPASADAVRSGRLVRALSYAGFGEVDLADAVAPPSTTTEGATAAKAPAATARTAKAERRLVEAEAAALEAAGRLDDAVRACRDAERAHDAAVRAEREQAAELERLAEQLAQVEARHHAAAAAASAAAKTARKSSARVERAQERAEQAREALDRLRRGD